jgi:hypothetical protein
VTLILSRLILIVARAKDDALNLKVLTSVAFMLSLLCSGTSECNRLAKHVKGKLEGRLGVIGADASKHGPMLKGALSKTDAAGKAQ